MCIVGFKNIYPFVHILYRNSILETWFINIKYNDVYFEKIIYQQFGRLSLL